MDVNHVGVEPERAPRPKRYLAAPHRRLALVLSVLVLLGLGVATLNLTLLDNARTPADQLNDRTLVAASHLRASSTGLAEIAPQFLSMLSLPPSERAVAAAALVGPNTRYQSEFESYLHLSLGLPGERALQQEFTRLSKASNDLSVALLAPETVSVAQVAQSAGVTFQMQNVLQRLEAMYQDRASTEAREVKHAQDAAHNWLLVSAGLALVIAAGLALWLVRKLRAEYRDTEGQASRNELESRLQRALEMAESEDDIFATVATAVRAAEPDLHVELLVADSSRAHLHRVMSANVSSTGGCPVATPTSCPATIQGQSQLFESSSAIDACPYLRTREDGPLSALCVPVTIAGRPTGVLHATSRDQRPPTTGTAAALELIARRTGERLSLVRAFARSETQAHTDPLTGLLNRRSLEHRVQDLVETGDPYIVAYADLDHFKALNDVHGHDVGDRALRLFAHVLRDSVRPSDIPARYGGEEFVVVLPECGVDDAVAVLERVRDRLADAVREGECPEFTVSAGLASSSVQKTFSEVVEAADRALLAAKAAGRDCVLISGAPIEIPDDASALDEGLPRSDDVRSE